MQSIEISPSGIMWILDGHRQHPHEDHNCPPRLVLLDIENNAKVLHTWEVPEELSPHDGGWLNDIVLDDEFAYITENSNPDPGLIVYSRKEDKGWKLRDRTMFAEIAAANIEVNGILVSSLLPIDGIALSPKRSGETERYEI